MGYIDVLLNCSWVSQLLSRCLTFLRACLVYMTDPLRKLQAKATHICFCSRKRVPISQRQKASIRILPEKENSKQRLSASLLSTTEWHGKKRATPVPSDVPVPENSTSINSSLLVYPRPPHAPLIRLASWTSFCIIVTRLAWMAHRLVSSNKCTMNASAASWSACMAWLCHRRESPLTGRRERPISRT